MINKSNICIDNWTDIKKMAYERADAAQKAADNNIFTKEFVRERISEYEQKDKQQSDTVHKEEINDKIANIISGENDFYTKEESDSKYASVDTIPTKTSQLANDSGFITESEINLSEYAKITDVSTKFQPKGDYLTAVDITGKSNVDDVYTKNEADAKFLTQHQDISIKAEQSDFDTLKNNIWIGDLSTGLFKTIYRTQNSNSESIIWNDSTGGCFMFTDKDSSIRCFSGVNNGNDPNHVFVQMYAIDTTNSGRSGPRISLTKNGAFYSTDITRVSEEYEIVTKGSLSDYAKSSDIANAYQPKGTYLTEHQSLIDYAKITDVSNALETKANKSDLLIAKSEYDLLKAKVEYLEQLISKYLPDNKAVEITEPM